MTETRIRYPSVRSAGPSPHRRWLRTLALCLLVALVGGAAFVAYRTPVLGLQRVTVTAGSGELTPAERQDVEQAVGVAVGTPLITVDLGSIRRRVLRLPQIASASVSRHWPNDLVVRVTARTPAAVTKANGSWWLLDGTGLPYTSVGQQPTGLLTVELATPGPSDGATLAALAVIGTLRAPIRPLVASVSARSPYAVTLRLIDGRTVIWGSADNGGKKMQILPGVLAQPGRSYDISDPKYVTVTG